MKSLPIHGRGASSDPPNRFTGLSVERGEWSHPDDPGPETRLYRDTSRSIITTNDSPDVGFEASINPYRGCEHGCVYCMSGDTPVLMADGSTRPLAGLERGDGIYGTVRRGSRRRYVRTRVLALWETEKPAYRITLSDGRELVASADHRLLTRRGWKFVRESVGVPGPHPRLIHGDRLMGLDRATEVPTPSAPSRAGHFAGAADERARLMERESGLTGSVVTSGRKLEVVAVEPVGRRPLFDITTGSGDFIAAGVVSHNCYARPGHEYLGLSPGLDFETRIFVKENAPGLLRQELASPGWTPTVLVMSGVTDPYQPVERRLNVTRGCLEVLAEARNPVSLITKNHLVTRDADLLAELARHDAARVTLSVTTLRNELQRVMEPRTVVPARRIRAIRELAEAGVPVGVNVAPVVPGLTEHELPGILEAAAEAGATHAGYIVLRLPHAVKDLFAEWLDQHFPDRKKKVLNRLRDLRGGRLNDPRFGSRMKGEGPYAEQIRQLFEVSCDRLSLNEDDGELSTAAFRRPAVDGEQLGLFS